MTTASLDLNKHQNTIYRILISYILSELSSVKDFNHFKN